MKQLALLYLIRVEIQKVIGFLLYVLGTGFSIPCTGALYFAYLFIATLIIGWILFKANAETLAERGKTNTNSPLWDKILLFIFWLLNYFVVYLFAGIAEQAEHFNIGFAFGILFTLFAAWLSTKATLENIFLESTARIQGDRNQTVCTTGPYRIVRHPAYSALIINCFGVSMIFPYVSVGICMAVTVIIVIIRTLFEDKMLKEGLNGYLDYTKETQYRLVPFVW